MKELIVLLFIWALWLSAIWWGLIADWIWYWSNWALSIWIFLITIWMFAVLKATDLLNKLK